VGSQWSLLRQLVILHEDTGVRRVPLEGATTPAQARSKMEELRVDRRKGQLPVLRRTPKFADYGEQYLDYYRICVVAPHFKARSGQFTTIRPGRGELKRPRWKRTNQEMETIVS